MRGYRRKYSQLKMNAVMFNNLFFSLSLCLSFPPGISSSLIKTWAVFSSITPCPAEVSFHVLPRPGRMPSSSVPGRSLPANSTPPSLGLLNNAIRRSPLTRAAPFSFIATPPRKRHAMQLKPLVDYKPPEGENQHGGRQN